MNELPLEHIHTSGNKEHIRIGRAAIADGKVACLVVAGGQGTRLGIKGPKGNFKLTHFTLFERLALKIKSASAQAKTPLCLAVMTSSDNDAATKKALTPLLPKEQLFFFTQENLPFLDKEGRPMTVQGPDGNGHALHQLKKSGILKTWKKKGIEWVTFILIDNPLADPFDPEMVGLSCTSLADVVIKATPRLSPEEKVGILVQKRKKIAVVEYSEIQKETDTPYLANLSLFCFSVPFIERATKRPLPLHKAWKKAGNTMGFKQERFIFDLLPRSKKTEVIVYPREQIFAPLKNKTGLDSPETCRQAIQQEDRRIFYQVTGLPAPAIAFELHPAFYTPTKAILTKWRGQKWEGKEGELIEP